MAWSKTCKIGTFIGISASAILLLIILINVSSVCENRSELYHSPTKKCYPKLSPTPCSQSLVLLEESKNSQYGQCMCPHSEYDRSFLFHPETQHCYLIFTRGFCDEGYWVNVTREGKPFCEPNRCLSVYSGHNVPDEVVPLKNGKCGILNKWAEGCKENEVVQFYPNHILPRCDRPKKKVAVSSIGVPASQCPLGSYASMMGKCQPDFDFDK